MGNNGQNLLKVASEDCRDATESAVTAREVLADILECEVNGIVYHPVRHGRLIPNDKRCLAEKVGQLCTTLNETGGVLGNVEGDMEPFMSCTSAR
jgi:hypothetical protein